MKKTCRCVCTHADMLTEIRNIDNRCSIIIKQL